MLWLVGVVAAFFIKFYKTLFIDDPDENKDGNNENNSDDEEDIMGSSHQIVVDVEDDKEDDAEEDDNNDFDQYDILGEEEQELSGERILPEPDTEQNQRVADYCAVELGLDVSDDNDGCDLDRVDEHYKAVTSSEKIFEEILTDTEKVEKLADTSAKLEDSVYFNKLKENKAVNNNIARLVDISQELYRQKLMKVLN